MYKYLPAKVEKKISVLRIFREKIRGFLWQIAGECVPLQPKKKIYQLFILNNYEEEKTV
jgi:hypothetical protein